MKICEEFAALLDAFVDGELSPEEAQAVQTHLNTCSACQAYVDDALAIRAAFPTVEDTEVPADFAQGVMNAIHTQSAPAASHRHQPWGRVLLPIAACFALVLVLKSAIPTSQSEKSAPPEAAPTYSTDTRVLKDTPEETPAVAPVQEHIPESVAPPAPADATPESPAALYQIPTPTRRDAEPPSYFARITLTAQEAGELLSGFAPVSETETERVYELTETDYQILLDSLNAAGISPIAEASDMADGSTLALVTVLY